MNRVSTNRGAHGQTPRPNAAGIPQGGYRDSCQGCSVAAGVLTCYCRAADGRQHPAALAVGACAAGEAIDNADGVLACVTAA